MKDNLQIATQYKYDSISGRYVTTEHVDLFLDTLTSKFKITTAGYSVQNKNIKAIQFGKGAIKILVWSQMHGNESSTTKGLIDYLNYLNCNEKEFDNISKSSSDHKEHSKFIKFATTSFFKYTFIWSVVCTNTAFAFLYKS